jgi:peptidyl-prolyl cis-trans isomerase D
MFRGATHHTKTIWWILIFITAGSFLFGFVFLLGSGIGGGSGAGNRTVAGKVNGQTIQWVEYQNAVATQRESYRQQYGAEPADRDERMVEVQAWRNLVMEKVLAEEARRLKIPTYDREVMLTLESSPPQQLTNLPNFQTDGKFDPAKYQQALRDPGNNWRPFEDMVRDQLPVRKLQERLMASIKLSEPELLQAFHDRYDRASVTVVQVPAAHDTTVPAPTEADIERAYQQHKGRFASDTRVQLEVLVQPKRAGEEEQRAAREMAQSLVNRARAGEDFATLVRDFSEGPNADKGGEVDRFFQADEFGPENGPKIAALNQGDISDPFPDGTRFVVVKVIEKTPAAPPVRPAIKIAQLVIKVRPNDATFNEQYDEMKKLRDRAKRVGLGRAAAEKGLATTRTEWFDFNGSPQALFGVPEAGDWGLAAKQNEVSPVFVGVDEMAIVQVADRRAAGVAPREELTDALRQYARLDARVEKNKPIADAIAASLAGGGTLETAAAAAALPVSRIEGVTRSRPDPRLAGAPEFVGAIFSAAPGKVVGPVRGQNGWYFGRLESVAVADTALYNAQKGAITSEILQRRQQQFLMGFLADVRSKATVEDHRTGMQSR